MKMLSCLLGFLDAFCCFVFLFAYKQGSVIGLSFPDGKIVLLAAPVTK